MNLLPHAFRTPLRQLKELSRVLHSIVAACAVLGLVVTSTVAGELKAGAAKIDVSHPDQGPAQPPLYVRVVVFTDGESTAVLAAVDAVAIGQIGPIRSDYLATVRGELKKQLGLDPSRFMINASHCHGTVCSDIADRTVQVVKQALANLEPVRVGVAVGHEDRIMENRRLKLKSGREADVRHAYSLPADEQVAEVGPVDPQIGVLRVDRVRDGSTLAVVYNFACHPIQGVPSGANTADITGFSSQVIEETLGNDAIALFVQGCGGDINPVMYKDVARPRDAEPLGNLLALSTLKAVRKATPQANSSLKCLNESLELPRADLLDRIAAQEAEQQRLLRSLRGTSLNFKTFLPLAVKYSSGGDFPSYYSHAYLTEKMLGRADWEKLDNDNRKNMEAYLNNIQTMEELTRVQTNLALLRMHQGQNEAAGKRTVDVEVCGLRVGEFVLLTFPGELTVRIGLGIKKRSPHRHTFVAGYTNGYIYYAPTAEQLLNVGNAQEDSDCILAPEWQAIFEEKAFDVLKRL